jgi:hypothetical protein
MSPQSRWRRKRPAPGALWAVPIEPGDPFLGELRRGHREYIVLQDANSAPRAIRRDKTDALSRSVTHQIPLPPS